MTLCFLGSQSSRQWGIKINILHESFVLSAIPEEVGEILARSVAFMLGLADFVLALADILDIPSKAGLQVAGGYTEDTADFGGDPIGIGMNIVYFV